MPGSTGHGILDVNGLYRYSHTHTGKEISVTRVRDQTVLKPLIKTTKIMQYSVLKSPLTILVFTSVKSTR